MKMPAPCGAGTGMNRTPRGQRNELTVIAEPAAKAEEPGVDMARGSVMAAAATRVASSTRLVHMVRLLVSHPRDQGTRRTAGALPVGGRKPRRSRPTGRVGRCRYLPGLLVSLSLSRWIFASGVLFALPGFFAFAPEAPALAAALSLMAAAPWAEGDVLSLSIDS